MGLRERLMGWLDRGPAPAPGDPDAPVEIANEVLYDGPRLLGALADAGIEAHGIEATTDALHGSARTRMRILVRRSDAERALAVLEADRRRRGGVA